MIFMLRGGNMIIICQILIILTFTLYAAIVELLINDGKQITAVHFIHAFQLEESFPTVPLLKLYLKNVRRNSQVKAGNVDDVATVKVCFGASLKFKSIMIVCILNVSCSALLSIICKFSFICRMMPMHENWLH